MTNANWITLIVTLVGIAATWGGLLVRVKVAESRLREFERGREKQGERLGVVEERVASIEGTLMISPETPRKRARTRPIPVAEPEGEGDDE